MQNVEGLGWDTDVDGVLPAARYVVGNVFAWSSPVDQLAAIDVARVLLVFPCPPYMLLQLARRRCI